MDDKIYERIALALVAIAVLAYLVNIVMTVPALRTEGTAAWVQAIGSIGAISVAIWVSHNAERETRKQAIQNGHIFAGKLLNCLAGLQGACATQNVVQIMALITTLNELVVFGRSLKLDSLNANDAWALFDIRANAAEADDFAKRLGPTSMHLDHAGGEFHRLREAVLSAAVKYGCDHA